MKPRLVLLCCLFLSSQAWAQEAARPVQKAGNKWVIERFDHWKKEVTGTRENRITEVADASIRLESKDIGTGNSLPILFDMEGNLVEVENRKFEPPQRWYSFPLTVGKTWQYSSAVPNAQRTGTFTEKRTCEVLAFEDVATKAGTFKSFKIRCDGTYEFRGSNQVWGGELFSTRWYAPDARYFVKHEYKSNGPRGVWDQYVDQLVSFELQK